MISMIMTPNTRPLAYTITRKPVIYGIKRSTARITPRKFCILNYKHHRQLAQKTLHYNGYTGQRKTLLAWQDWKRLLLGRHKILLCHFLSPFCPLSQREDVCKASDFFKDVQCLQ